jgi:hypothetical protein
MERGPGSAETGLVAGRRRSVPWARSPQLSPATLADLPTVVLALPNRHQTQRRHSPHSSIFTEADRVEMCNFVRRRSLGIG